MATKDDLRQLAKHKQSKLDPYKSSISIINRIKKWDKYKSAENVMIYYPIKNEINLLGLYGDKNLFLPRLRNNEIEVCPYPGEDSILPGKFGIPEPLTGAIEDLCILDIIFVPALAADRWGYRLGYGCGYYDRFLEHVGAKTARVIPLYSELLFDDIPFEAHDQKADFIVTEDELFSTSIKIAL